MGVRSCRPSIFLLSGLSIFPTGADWELPKLKKLWSTLVKYKTKFEKGVISWNMFPDMVSKVAFLLRYFQLKCIKCIILFPGQFSRAFCSNTTVRILPALSCCSLFSKRQARMKSR